MTKMAMRGIRLVVCLHLILCFTLFSNSADDQDEETLHNSESIIKGQDEEENMDGNYTSFVSAKKIPIAKKIAGMNTCSFTLKL